MKFYKSFLFLILPHKFYGGGGGQTPQTNPEEQALAAISQEKWDEYKKRYVPLENKWIANVKHMNDQSYHNEAAGMASNEVKAQYGSQTGGLAKSMSGQRMGGNDYLAQANNITQSVNRAGIGVTDRSLRGTQDVIAMGQGQATTGVEGLGSVADAAVNAQIKTNTNKFDSDQGTKHAIGVMAGGAYAGSDNYKPKPKATE